ncbi:hypothetical protein [Alteromonas sp. RW2A1]|nr:hypothetical protein [Alteromonas sp. RW2A1]
MKVFIGLHVITFISPRIQIKSAGFLDKWLEKINSPLVEHSDRKEQE